MQKETSVTAVVREYEILQLIRVNQFLPGYDDRLQWWRGGRQQKAKLGCLVYLNNG